MRAGYSMFAVQNGGWCAASATAPQTFNKYGKSTACKSDGEGGPWANQVYVIKGNWNTFYHAALGVENASKFETLTFFSAILKRFNYCQGGRHSKTASWKNEDCKQVARERLKETTTETWADIWLKLYDIHSFWLTIPCQSVEKCLQCCYVSNSLSNNHHDKIKTLFDANECGKTAVVFLLKFRDF